MDIYAAQIPPDDLPAIRAVAGELAGEFGSCEDPGFQAKAAVGAQELPRSLRASLYEFRLAEPCGVCVVTGYPVDDRELGPTPFHWREAPPSPAVLVHEAFLFMCATLLGEPFAWSTEQRGRVMHNVVPIKATENAQLGSSSLTPLTWHTEDGFHPCRADYVGLMCLRNPDAAETTFASVRDVSLPADLVEVLRQPRFVILPDEAHLSLEHSAPRTRTGVPTALVERAHQGVCQMRDEPEPVSALFGAPDSPYLRVNSYYMHALDGDEAAGRALKALIAALDSRLGGLPLRPGEICFLDNFTVVHGRSAFRARYDGTDRWLKRLNVTRDLRRSRALRVSAVSRTVF